MDEVSFNTLKNRFAIGFLTLIFVAIDLVTKYLAIQKLTKNPFIITSWLSLRYAENKGIAWSLPIPPLLIIMAGCFLILALLYFVFKYCDTQKKLTQLAFGLLLGGAIGNLIDRLSHGYVVDFINFSFWPIFNLADIFITIGVFLLILFYDKIKRYGRSKPTISPD